jgi:hypothetical protein
VSSWTFYTKSRVFTQKGFITQSQRIRKLELDIALLDMSIANHHTDPHFLRRELKRKKERLERMLR